MYLWSMFNRELTLLLNKWEIWKQIWKKTPQEIPKIIELSIKMKLIRSKKLINIIFKQVYRCTWTRFLYWSDLLMNLSILGTQMKALENTQSTMYKQSLQIWHNIFSTLIIILAKFSNILLFHSDSHFRWRYFLLLRQFCEVT